MPPQRLFVAQPAVSQQIMNLEKDLGVRLFDRNKRSVKLTDAGAAFLGPCREALGAVENAGLLARNAGTGEYGKIRVGFNAGFATDHLVALVQVLRREHPHLELEIDNSRRDPGHPEAAPRGPAGHRAGRRARPRVLGSRSGRSPRRGWAC